MDVVHVVAVWYRDVPAVRSVFVLVFGVLSMCRSHGCSFFPRNGQLELHTQLHYQVRISAGSHIFADCAPQPAPDTHTEIDSAAEGGQHGRFSACNAGIGSDQQTYTGSRPAQPRSRYRVADSSHL